MEVDLLECAFLMIFFISGECTLLETATQSSACYNLPVSLSCNAGNVIAINEVKIGAQKSTSSCPLTWSSGTDTACCSSSANIADDCLFSIDTESNQLYHDTCNGRDVCSPASLNEVLSTTKCGITDISEYPVATHYMIITYYCIQESRTINTCSDTFPKTVENSNVYLWNPGFPASSFPSSISSCTCSIESDNCNSLLQVVTIQRELAENSSGVCEQVMLVADQSDSQVLRWDCADNSVTMTTVNTSSSYLKINLQNSRTSDAGQFWLGFYASQSSNLTVNCPAQAATSCLTTTTPVAAPTAAQTAAPTTAPTAAPTTAPTEAPTTAPSVAPTVATTSTSAAAKPSSTISNETSRTTILIAIIVPIIFLLVIATIAFAIWWFKCRSRNNRVHDNEAEHDNSNVDLCIKNSSLTMNPHPEKDV